MKLHLPLGLRRALYHTFIALLTGTAAFAGYAAADEEIKEIEEPLSDPVVVNDGQTHEYTSESGTHRTYTYTRTDAVVGEETQAFQLDNGTVVVDGATLEVTTNGGMSMASVSDGNASLKATSGGIINLTSTATSASSKTASEWFKFYIAASKEKDGNPTATLAADGEGSQINIHFGAFTGAYADYIDGKLNPTPNRGAIYLGFEDPRFIGSAGTVNLSATNGGKLTFDDQGKSSYGGFVESWVANTNITASDGGVFSVNAMYRGNGITTINVSGGGKANFGYEYYTQSYATTTINVDGAESEVYIASNFWNSDDNDVYTISDGGKLEIEGYYYFYSGSKTRAGATVNVSGPGSRFAVKDTQYGMLNIGGIGYFYLSDGGCMKAELIDNRRRALDSGVNYDGELHFSVSGTDEDGNASIFKVSQEYYNKGVSTVHVKDGGVFDVCGTYQDDSNKTQYSRLMNYEGSEMTVNVSDSGSQALFADIYNYGYNSLVGKLTFNVSDDAYAYLDYTVNYGGAHTINIENGGEVVMGNYYSYDYTGSAGSAVFNVGGIISNEAGSGEGSLIIDKYENRLYKGVGADSTFNISGAKGGRGVVEITTQFWNRGGVATFNVLRGGLLDITGAHYGGGTNYVNVDGAGSEAHYVSYANYLADAYSAVTVTKGGIMNVDSVYQNDGTSILTVDGADSVADIAQYHNYGTSILTVDGADSVADIAQYYNYGTTSMKAGNGGLISLGYYADYADDTATAHTSITLADGGKLEVTDALWLTGATLTFGGVSETTESDVHTLAMYGAATTVAVVDMEKLELGRYALLNYDELLQSRAASLALLTPGAVPAEAGLSYGLDMDAEADGVLWLVVMKEGGSVLIWDATLTGGTWAEDDAAGSEWKTPVGGTSPFDAGDAVIFEGGAAAVAGEAAPGSIVVRGSADTTITSDAVHPGSITGDASLVKEGTGTLTISTANSYSGGTTINGGTVNATNSAALGTGGIAINGGLLTGADLTLTQDLAITGGEVANNLNGASGVVKTGTGAATLSGDNTYAGETQVQEGTLTIAGTLTGTTATVAKDATLAVSASTALDSLTVAGSVTGADGTTIGAKELTLAAGASLTAGTNSSVTTDTLALGEGTTLSTTQVSGKLTAVGANASLTASENSSLTADELTLGAGTTISLGTNSTFSATTLNLSDKASLSATQVSATDSLALGTNATLTADTVQATNVTMGSGAAISGALTIDGGTLALDSTGTLASVGTLNVGEGSMLSLTGVALESLTTGSYSLLGYTDALTGFENLTLAGAGSGEFLTYTLQTHNSELQLVVKSADSVLTWMATESTWNIGEAGDKWDMDGKQVVFGNGDKIIFAGGTANIEAEVAPGGILVQGVDDTTLQGTGSIVGDTALTMNGTGTLTIATANAYTGGTTINSGTVAVSESSALGSGSVTVGNGTDAAKLSSSGDLAVGDLAVNASSTVEVAGKLTVAGGSVSEGASLKAGSFENTDALTLTGAAVDFGSTVVGGALTLDGVTGALGETTVDGQQLTISNTAAEGIAADITVSNGGVLTLNAARVEGDVSLKGRGDTLNMTGSTISGSLTSDNYGEIYVFGVNTVDKLIVDETTVVDNTKGTLVVLQGAEVSGGTFDVGTLKGDLDVSSGTAVVGQGSTVTEDENGNGGNIVLGGNTKKTDTSKLEVQGSFAMESGKELEIRESVGDNVMEFRDGTFTAENLTGTGDVELKGEGSIVFRGADSTHTGDITSELAGTISATTENALGTGGTLSLNDPNAQIVITANQQKDIGIANKATLDTAGNAVTLAGKVEGDTLVIGNAETGAGSHVELTHADNALKAVEVESNSSLTTAGGIYTSATNKGALDATQAVIDTLVNNSTAAGTTLTDSTVTTIENQQGTVSLAGSNTLDASKAPGRVVGALSGAGTLEKKGGNMATISGSDASFAPGQAPTAVGAYTLEVTEGGLVLEGTLRDGTLRADKGTAIHVKDGRNAIGRLALNSNPDGRPSGSYDKLEDTQVYVYEAGNGGDYLDSATGAALDANGADLNILSLQGGEGAYADGDKALVGRGVTGFDPEVKHAFATRNLNLVEEDGDSYVAVSTNHVGAKKNLMQQGVSRALVASAGADGELGVLLHSLAHTGSEADALAALDSIGGAGIATTMAAQMSANRDHMRTLRGAIGQPVMFYTPGGGKGALAQWDEKANLWTMATGASADLGNDGMGGVGYTRHDAGFLVGGDVTFCRNALAGLAAGYSRSHVDSGGHTISGDEYYIDLYGRYNSGNFSHAATFGLGFYDWDLDRIVNVKTGDLYADFFGTGKGQAKGMAVNFSYEVAYDIRLTESQTLAPLFMLESSFNTLDGYRESGTLGNAGLDVRFDDAWATTFGLGARYTCAFDGLGDSWQKASVSARAMLVLDAGDVNGCMTGSLIGSGAAFRAESTKNGRVGLLLGADVFLPVSRDWSVFGNVNFEVREDYRDLSAGIGVKYSF